MRRTTAAVAVLLLGLQAMTRVAGAAGSPRSLGDSLTDDAKRDYQTGKLLASDGDFAGAALKFQSAYDRSHDARLLWNIAFCEKQLRHYARVLALLERYESEGGALLAARDRKDAHELATALQPFTTTVKITVSEEGAEVFVDDERVGLSPLPSTRVVDIGTHRVRATKAGFLEASVVVPVGGGVDLPVALHLEKEVHEGKLVVRAQASASILLDGQPIGTGSAERVVSSGGHQLLVQAPGMRAYQSEVVVGEKETRSLDVSLERESEQELPRVQVAVGCVDSVPRSTAEGLAVYLDGATVAAAPVDVRTRRDADRKRDVVAWVSYPAPLGQHTLDVSVPGCVPAHVRVDVRDAHGTRIEGSLPPVPETLAEGAAGSPDGWRVGAGAWSGSLVQDDLYGDLFGGTGVYTPARPRGTSVVVTGASIEGGAVQRWWTVMGQATVAFGTTGGTTAGVTSTALGPTFGPVSTEGTLTAFRLGVRAGPRLPLGPVALSAGVSGALGVEAVAGQLASSVTHTGVLGGVWLGVDVKPMCDWSATLALQDDVASSMGWLTLGGALLVGYEPNARCRGERSTRYAVEERAP